MRLTRRELGTVLVAGAAAAQSSAQLPPAPEAEFEAASEQLKAMIARLAAQAVPMATEPSFRFEA